MSLATLPEELLEILFLYLNKEDLIAVRNAIGFEGSNSFWRKICKREAFRLNSEEDNNWKTVFYRNVNWTTGKFRKREYNFEKYARGFLGIDNFGSTGIYLEDVLHGKNLIFKSSENEISIWNIENQPELIAKLPAQFLRVSGSKLLVYDTPNTKVYLSNQNTYCELLNLTDNLSGNVSSDYTLTDEYFAAFDDSLTSIKVVNIENKAAYLLPVSDKKVKPFTIKISGFILHIMVLEGSQYVLRRYNLDKREWLEDILLFQEEFFIKVPGLAISSKIFVSWSSFLLDDGITPLKIWKSNGEFLKSLSFPFIQSFGTQHQPPPANILWLIVEGEYIIFQIYLTSIIIWTSKEPNICKELPTSARFYTGQNVISSHLLVLSYIHCFKVIDFQKVVYLYHVLFQDRPNRADFISYRPYYVNEYFYVYFKVREDGIDEKLANIIQSKSMAEDSSNNEVSYNLDGFCHKSKVNTARPVRSYILTIYDFRVNSD